LHWLDSVPESELYLSALTLGEIRKGLASMARSRRRSQIESWLERDLRIRFSGRILPVDDEVALRWGGLMARAKAEGNSLPAIDGLLAATALQHGLTAVSRNARDFAVAKVEVLNPWTGS
jgi:predicted nucleic acid-binding protein